MSSSVLRLTRICLPWVAMMSALPARAAEPQRCATIVEDAARLACYDAVYGAPARPAAATPGQVAPVSAAASSPATAPAVAGVAVGTTATAAAAASPEAQFGLTPAQVKKQPEPSPEPAAPESIESVLKELTKRRTGELIYTLENGQRWIQSEADSAGKLSPGAVVTIRKASMGSYKLVSGDVATKVRRIE
jgi:hypothetical protein